LIWCHKIIEQSRHIRHHAEKDEDYDMQTVVSAVLLYERGIESLTTKKYEKIRSSLQINAHENA